MAIHSTGATIASEKFSARLSIAARATPASSSAAVSRPTICDTARAAGGDAVGLKRGGDIRDVPVQAALRDQGAGEQAPWRTIPNGRRKQLMLDDEGDRSDDAEQDQNCDDAGAAPPVRRCRRRG